jgi:hypothetical protein
VKSLSELRIQQFATNYAGWTASHHGVRRVRVVGWSSHWELVIAELLSGDPIFTWSDLDEHDRLTAEASTQPARFIYTNTDWLSDLQPPEPTK